MGWKVRRSLMGKETSSWMAKRLKARSNIIKNRNKSDFITSIFHLLYIFLNYAYINFIISNKCDFARSLE